MSEPAEGWYADPSGAGQLRWWDGHAWTEYVERYEARSPQVDEARVPAADASPASPRVDEHSDLRRAADTAPTPAYEATTAAVAGIEPTQAAAREAIAAPADDTEDADGFGLPDEADSGTETPTRSSTLKWALGCVASWLLVAVFIAVLVLAWSHLGASGRIHEDAKARAESAQRELDTARSTLEDINRQIEEAQK